MPGCETISVDSNLQGISFQELGGGLCIQGQFDFWVTRGHQGADTLGFEINLDYMDEHWPR